MSKESRLSLLFVFACVALVATAGRRGCFKDQIAMLTAVPANPRYMSFILRSYAGSRQHLVVAAAKMLLESRVGDGAKNFGTPHNFHILEAAAGLPEHVLGAATYYTRATIQDAVAVAAEIERKLEDTAKPGARETIRIDLVWVQGVELRTPGLRLPHPDLWSDGNWADSWWESIGANASPDDREVFHLRDLVDRATPRQKIRCDVGVRIEEEIALHRLPDHNYWTSFSHDLPDALATAGNMIPAAALERQAELSTHRAPVSAALAAEIEKLTPNRWSDAAGLENSETNRRGTEALRRKSVVRLDMAVPLQAPFDPDTGMPRWVSEVQAVSRLAHLQLGMVIITRFGAGEIRGLLLGQTVQVMPEGVEILSARFWRKPEKVSSAVGVRVDTGGLFH